MDRNSIMNEEWRAIDQHYEVSNLGSVRRKETGYVLSQTTTAKGYRRVTLWTPKRTLMVHRLVGQAFVPNPDNKPFINHLDCDRSGNHSDNLEWCTQAENVRYSARLGRYDDYWVENRSVNAKLTDDQIRAIRSLCATGSWSRKRLAREFSACKSTIARIVRGEVYRNVRCEVPA
jgi:hypothetical protein